MQHLDNSPAHQYDNDDSDDDENHSDEDEQPHCDTCARSFVDTPSLYQHLAASPKHNWCFACSRDFSSAAALDQVSVNIIWYVYWLPINNYSQALELAGAQSPRPELPFVLESIQVPILYSTPC